jgi:phage protein D
MPGSVAAPHYRIVLDKKDRPEIQTDLLSFVIERDMFQPDMATIVLSNQGGQYSGTELGAPVEIFIGDDDGTSVYQGEVIGLEPVYRGGEKSRIVLRAMNKLHRLLRLRKSRTFTGKTDSAILKEVVGDAGLKLEFKHEKDQQKPLEYKHVYQHNQTDIEFLRTRAARIGCHVWCVGDVVHVKQPDLQQQPKVKLNTSRPGGDEATTAAIKSFTPRLSTANILKKVTVKGWNPETKELIVGEYSAQTSKLGPTNAVTAAKKLAAEETFMVDHPIWSKEEADVLAKARLVDLSLGFITGECELTLDPERTLGEVVSITVNGEDDTKQTDPFNGRYYVMGVTHRFVTASKEGGYTTALRVARDAQQQVADDVGRVAQAGAA